MAQADEVWNNSPDLMDDDGEVRELTAQDFAMFRPFADLPEDLQDLLLSVNSGSSVEPPPVEEVTLMLSRPVLAKFRATGTGWEGRVDEALREWLQGQKAS